MESNVVALNVGYISQMLLSATQIGQMQTSAGIAAAFAAERGAALDADMMLAAFRRYAVLKKDASLLNFIDELDETIDNGFAGPLRG